MTMIFDRAVLLFKVETVFRQEEVPDPALDALLIGAPEFNLDINQLSRDNVRADLSPLPTVAGRKVASVTFTHEVRNNGNLLGTVPPRIGQLLRACGYAQTQITAAAGTISNAVPDVGNVGTMTFAKTAAYEGYVDRVVTIDTTTGGASGSAKVTISAPAVGEVPALNLTNVTITTGSPISLGNGATVTPTLAGSLTIGDGWTFNLSPAGYEYSPISDSMESGTLYLYRDGLLHKMTGARGTWSVQGTGGTFALFTFTFTGDYVQVTDAAMPGGVVYETQKPTQVELANLTINGFSNFAAAEFSIDAQNDVQIREDINASDAYAGGIIVGRAPTASFNPEAVLEAVHPVWANLASGLEMAFHVKVGKAKGNVVAFDCPNTQYTNVAYGNRNSILTYDITLNCARNQGNDELVVSFR